MTFLCVGIARGRCLDTGQQDCLPHSTVGRHLHVSTRERAKFGVVISGGAVTLLLPEQLQLMVSGHTDDFRAAGAVNERRNNNLLYTGHCNRFSGHARARRGRYLRWEKNFKRGVAVGVRRDGRI